MTKTPEQTFQQFSHGLLLYIEKGLFGKSQPDKAL